MALVARLGCMVGHGCEGRITIHHCGTYMGGGRDHKRIIGLCWLHHLGPAGIDGKQMSKRQWEAKYGTEEQLMAKLQKLLESK